MGGKPGMTLGQDILLQGNEGEGMEGIHQDFYYKNYYQL
jgi:hypothetical protein